MNFDLALIAKVLETGDIRTAIREGIEPGMLGHEAQLYWDKLISHYNEAHECMSLDMFRTDGSFSSYEHVPPKDSIEAIINQLKTRKLAREIDDGLDAIAGINIADPWKAQQRLLEVASHLQMNNQRHRTDSQVGFFADAIFSELDRAAVGGGVIGIPWPWQYMNEQTSGMEDGNFIYIYGRQKSKKTWLLLYIAYYLALEGYKVLFCTREMTRKELERRFYCLLAEDVSWPDFKKGRYDKSVVEPRVRRKLEKIKDKIVWTDVADGTIGLKAKVEEIDPEIVIHDCIKSVADDEMHRMKRTDEHRVVGMIATQLKEYFFQKAKIPFVAAGHANRTGEKSGGKSKSEHAWSDEITRRVDIAVRVIKDDRMKRLALVINTARDAEESVGFTVNGTLRGDAFGDELESNCDWVGDEDVQAADDSRTRRTKQVDRAMPQPPTAGPMFKQRKLRG